MDKESSCLRSSPSLHPSLLLAMTSNLHFPSVANKKHPSSSIITMIRSLEPTNPPQPPPSSSSTSARIVHSTNVQMPKRQMVVSAFSSRHCNEPSNVSSASASSAMSSSSSSTSNSTSGSSLSLSSLRAARNSYSSCTSSSSLSPRILDQHPNGNNNGNTHTRYTQRPHPQYSQPLITSHHQQQHHSNKQHNGNDSSRGILKNGSGSTIAVPAIIARGEDNEDGGGSPSPPPLPPRSFNLSKSAPQLTGSSNNNCGYNNRFDNNMNNKRLPPPLPPKSDSYSQNKNQASRMHHSNHNAAPMNRIPSSHESNPLLRYNNNANVDHQQSSYEMDQQSSNHNNLSKNGSNVVNKSQSVVHSSSASIASTSSSCVLKQLEVRHTF